MKNQLDDIRASIAVTEAASIEPIDVALVLRALLQSNLAMRRGEILGLRWDQVDWDAKRRF